MGLLSMLKINKDLPIRQRLRQGQKRSQFVMAFNLSLLAIALPLGWNMTVKKRWEEFQEAMSKREKGWVKAQAEQERLAIQLIVNERRAARGVPPYPYNDLSASLRPETASHGLLLAIADVEAKMKEDKGAVFRELTRDRRQQAKAEQEK